MKQVILTLGIFSLGFLVSCDNSSESTTEKDAQEITHEEEHPQGENEHPADQDHHHDDGEEIALNDGKRWEVNEEMKPYVKQGQEFVITYYDSGDEDYKSLAENLAEQNKKLISSCTMQGESHDELHKWLHPHLELTKELKNAEDLEEANEVVKELMNSYSEYHKYFK